MGDERGYTYPKEELAKVMEEACFFYECELDSCPEARRYLADKRGIHPETIRSERIGYAPPNNKLIRKLNIEEGYPLRLLAAAGLVTIDEETPDPNNPEVGKKTYDFFRSRIMVPLSQGGKVVGFSGRDIGGKARAKYLNTRNTPLYTKSTFLYHLDKALQSARETGRLYIVEGAFDVISAVQAKVHDIVAPCGTALTEDHIKRIDQRLPGLEKIVVFDGDEAGFDAAERVADGLGGYGLKIATLSEGKDPDDYFREGLTTLFLREMENAQGAFDFSFFQKAMRIDPKGKGILASPDDKLRLLQEMEQVVRRMPEERRPLYRETLETQGAELLGLSSEAVRSFFNPTQGTHERYGVSSSHQIRWESQLVRMLVALNGDATMMRYCETFDIGKSLTSPEAHALYQLFVERGQELPLVNLNAPLFRQQAMTAIIAEAQTYKRPEEILDLARIRTLLDTSLIMTPLGARTGGKITMNEIDDALSHLLVPKVARGLQKAYQGKHISVRRIAKLAQAAHAIGKRKTK